MKKHLTTALFGLSLLSMLSVQANDFDPLELEPCINGGVSVSGLYPSQALENRYGTFDDLDLEPTLNGDVSASGLFPDQEIEEAANRAG